MVDGVHHHAARLVAALESDESMVEPRLQRVRSELSTYEGEPGPDRRERPPDPDSAGQAHGEHAFVFYDGDEVDRAGFLQLDETGRIAHIYVVRNPDKLTLIPRLS